MHRVLADHLRQGKSGAVSSSASSPIEVDVPRLARLAGLSLSDAEAAAVSHDVAQLVGWVQLRPDAAAEAKLAQTPPLVSFAADAARPFVPADFAEPGSVSDPTRSLLAFSHAVEQSAGLYIVRPPSHSNE
ncbi:hypothetical protein BCR33DRAFT_714564 [Rhizoclosmatium globosum]|uniref:Uncharacterized protein n=1 Tax=Rhizoclosmatium globosum TaxID=329046 RepID=A0A1Y2CMA8_9FUNG|nr:hypothetical protein BCR33DRAFT_714564 [Rhizoclosmatium globosum]|eukprot:ORY48142.1 hypothetical protein BCR33DRAFT_714564 [Rhizoclosmatium globosum]